MPSFLEYAADRKGVQQIPKIDDQPVQQELERSGPDLNSPILHDATTTTESAEPQSAEPTPAPQKQTSLQAISTRLATAVHRLQSALWH